MATLNYVTLKVPEILFSNIETIQKCTHFNVCRYRMQKGVIFRIPHDLRAGMMVHCFIEHEVNLSNTLKTGTLTLKVQCTMVPVHMGVFSGFKKLNGGYRTNWFDEESYGEDYFVPDYRSPENEIYVAPLPLGIKSNLSSYLDEILFKHCDDTNLLHSYAVNLGCQRDTIRKATYVPAPELHSNLPRAKRQHGKWIDFFAMAEKGEVALLPENQLKLEM